MQCQLAGRHRFEGQIVINAIYPIPRIMIHVEETSAIYSSIKIPSIFTIRVRRKIVSRRYERVYEIRIYIYTHERDVCFRIAKASSMT